LYARIDGKGSTSGANKVGTSLPIDLCAACCRRAVHELNGEKNDSALSSTCPTYPLALKSRNATTKSTLKNGARKQDIWEDSMARARRLEAIGKLEAAHKAYDRALGALEKPASGGGDARLQATLKSLTF